MDNHIETDNSNGDACYIKWPDEIKGERKNDTVDNAKEVADTTGYDRYCRHRRQKQDADSKEIRDIDRAMHILPGNICLNIVDTGLPNRPSRLLSGKFQFYSQ